MNDGLRQSLSDIADDVHYVDLHQRALGRSRRIRRNRAAAATVSALAVLGLAGFVLVTLGPQRSRPGPPVAASAPASGSASPSVSGGGGPAKVAMAVPQSTSLKDLTGHVFYRSPQDGSVVRITGGGARSTVLSKANKAVAVAPDGEKIAYVANGKLYLSGSDQSLGSGEVDLTKQFPAWSPDSARLLVAAPEPSVLTVATGASGQIPGGLTGQDFRWSGDGSKLVYLSGSRLRVDGTTVPVWGAQGADNPEQLSAGVPLSADPTAARITMALSGGRDVGDGRSRQPDTVVNTATGAIEVIPVPGDVQGAVFDTEGRLLVRAEDGDRVVLSVFSASGTLLVQAAEPGSVKDLELVAYTR
jgi:TolB protein